MAKKEKFPLEMHGVEVRTIEELKKNFSVPAVLEYFRSGKLLTWLNDRYYDEEAEQVEELDKNLPLEELAVKLREIFEIEDPEAAERRRARLEKLSEFTNDKEFTDNIDLVAFSQEELGELIDNEADTVYLCGESFRIPLSVENVRYIGVNSPVITIKCRGTIDLSEKGIAIERCTFDEGTKAKLADSRCDSKLEKKEAPAKSDKDVTEIDPKPTVYEQVTKTTQVDSSAPVTEETIVPDEEVYEDDEEYEDDILDDNDNSTGTDIGEGKWYSSSSKNSIYTNSIYVSNSGVDGWKKSGTFYPIKDETAMQCIHLIYNTTNSEEIALKIFRNFQKAGKIGKGYISLQTYFYNYTNDSRKNDDVLDAISIQSQITSDFIKSSKVLCCNRYTVKALGSGAIFNVSDKSRMPFFIGGANVGEVLVGIRADKWLEFFNKYVTPIIILPGPNLISEDNFKNLIYNTSGKRLIEYYNIIEHIAIDMKSLIDDFRHEELDEDKGYSYFANVLSAPWKCTDMKIDDFYKSAHY